MKMYITDETITEERRCSRHWQLSVTTWERRQQGLPLTHWKGHFWYLCPHSNKVITSAYLWEPSDKTGGFFYCMKPLFWPLWFRELSQVDEAFVQKVKHWFGFCLCPHFWISLCSAQCCLAILRSPSIHPDAVYQFFIHQTLCSSLLRPAFGTQQNGLVSAFDLNIHILAILKAVSLCCSDVHHPSSTDCSSSLQRLELSLITCCFGWTCRRQEFSFRETCSHNGEREHSSDWN